MYNHKSNRNLVPAFGGLLENAFKNDFGKFFYDDNWSNTTAPVNIKETDHAYVLDLVAPGLKKEEFNINVEKEVLSISFEHKEEQKEETDKVLRTEYQYRSFKRKFTLNDKINTADISAKYTDGILSITLPKKEVTEPSSKNIEIS